MQVAALFRHPIKSHGRESIDQVTLTAGQTMPWDRHWAVTHDATKFDTSAPGWAHCRNFMLGARTPALAGIWARLDEAERRVTLSHRDLPDLSFCPDDQSDVARFLNWVAPLCDPDRALPKDIISVPGRGMTDSDYPTVSVMNMASHDDVALALGNPITLERWRGNIWLQGATAWVEFDWIGRRLRLGEVVLLIREPIRRCMVTNTNPVTGLRDTETLDTLKTRFGHQDFGVYAEVVETGTLRTGDKATLI